MSIISHEEQFVTKNFKTNTTLNYLTTTFHFCERFIFYANVFFKLHIQNLQSLLKLLIREETDTKEMFQLISINQTNNVMKKNAIKTPKRRKN